MMPNMMLRRSYKILPVLLLASAGQPTYRLGAFIETVHASCRTCPKADGPGGDGPGEPSQDDAPEPSWPVELVALFPASIGSVEQTEWPTSLEIGDSNSLADSHPSSLKRRAARGALTVSSEAPVAASIGVVAHPIHAHAPPPVL